MCNHLTHRYAGAHRPKTQETMDDRLQSLQRQVERLAAKLARDKHEHSQAIGAKETSLCKRAKEQELLRKQISALNATQYQLKSSLDDMTFKAEAKANEVAQLKVEVRTLIRQLADAKKKHARHGEAALPRSHAALRQGIKALCRKYHPDKLGCERGDAVPHADVIRDLVSLLDEGKRA